MKKNILALPVLFTVLLWAVYLTNMILPLDLRIFGIVPRTASHLPGILISSFLHANIVHLTGNTLPLFILLLFLSIFYPAKAIDVIGIIIVSGGFLLWLFGRPSLHIGASLLIYGLASFCIFHGIMLKKIMPVLLSVIVILMYGSVLITGILPIHAHVSWEGHLFGGVGGAFAAWIMKKCEE